jgi:cobalt-zinc-cadmium efflux system protein
MSKESVNIKAAFLHNIADALASVAVIITGTLIILFDWYWTDIVATMGISVYIVWVSWSPMKRCIRILMQSTPEHLSIDSIAESLSLIDGVDAVAHLHVWPIDERTTSLEVSVGVAENATIQDTERIRRDAIDLLTKRYGIHHVTFETRLLVEVADRGLIQDHMP